MILQTSFALICKTDENKLIKCMEKRERLEEYIINSTQVKNIMQDIYSN